MTVPAPKRNEDIPIAIVAVRTKSISWMVDLNASGRPPGFGCSSLGGVSASAEGSVSIADGGVSSSPILMTLPCGDGVLVMLLKFVMKSRRRRMRRFPFLIVADWQSHSGSLVEFVRVGAAEARDI